LINQLHLVVQEWQSTHGHSQQLPLYPSECANIAPQTDTLVFWYRAHWKNATCSGGQPVRNAAFPADAVFAIALLATSATVTMDIGQNNHYQWDAPAGLSIGQVPFPQQDAQIPYLQILRNNAQVKAGYGSVYVTQVR
jgi:glucan endo-1,3-alpha-glucosidase